MRYAITFLKLILTFLLVYFVLKSVDFQRIQSEIFSQFGLILLSVATIFVLVQTVIAGYRLKPLLYLFDQNIPRSKGINLWFIGNFFSQFLISFIGGDGMRVLGLIRTGVRPGLAMRAIFLDRVVGFITLQTFFLMSLPFLLPIVKSDRIYMMLVGLALLSFVMIVAFFGLSTVPTNLTKIRLVNKILDVSSISRFLFRSRRITSEILILSFSVHICTFLSIYTLTNMMGESISILQVFYIGSTVILLSMLPISIGGWGVREGAMVLGFGMIGLNPDTAFVVSIIIGLSFVVGSIPGAFIFFLKNSERQVLATTQSNT